MKNIMKNSSVILIVIASLFIMSCKKKDNTTTPAIQNGALWLHIHTDIDTNEVDSGMIAMDAYHRHFQLNIGQYYISNIILIKSDGTTFPCSGVYLLKNIATEPYYVDSVPAGNYTSISFTIGLDAATNARNPTSFLASSVLYTQNPSMWFGNTSFGYMFMNVQGVADTMAADTTFVINPAHVNYPFTFQLGADTAARTINMPAQPFTVVAGTVQYVHIIGDYSKLFQGINFSQFALTNGIVTPWTNNSLCYQINNNIPNMFRYEY